MGCGCWGGGGGGWSDGAEYSCERVGGRSSGRLAAFGVDGRDWTERKLEGAKDAGGSS